MPTAWTCTYIDNGVVDTSSNCVVTASSTVQGVSTSSPVYVQDDGNLSFGLSVIIVILCLMVVAMVFNKLFKSYL